VLGERGRALDLAEEVRAAREGEQAAVEKALRAAGLLLLAEAPLLLLWC
jgi:hypothetical protein